MNKLQLAVQEQMIPGRTLEEKFALADRLGYASLELRGGPDFALEKRMKELERAKKAGVVMTSDCVDMKHFIGAFDPALSADAVENLKSQLTVMGEIGGERACVVTPAAWGMFSKRLPPHVPPRDEAGDWEVLVGALSELDAHAENVGARLLLEPLNRYENHMIVTLAQATRLITAAGGAGLGLVADTYHMNIEEDNLRDSIVASAPYLHHVQLGDSSRYQPGTGHFDWETTLKAFIEIDYDGYMAMECRLRDMNGREIDVAENPQAATAALGEGAAFMQEQWSLATAW